MISVHLSTFSLFFTESIYLICTAILGIVCKCNGQIMMIDDWKQKQKT